MNLKPQKCVPIEVSRKAPVLVYSLLMALCVLGAPASFAQEEASNTATFSIEGTTDSTDVKTRHYTVMQYENDQCKKPRKKARLFRKKYAREGHTFEPTTINSISSAEAETGRQFFFQVEYLEQRRQGDRSCTVLSGFVPEADKTYVAKYDVSGQVSRCSVAIFEMAEEPIELTLVTKPEFTCARGKPTYNKNSVPIHTVKPLF